MRPRALRLCLALGLVAPSSLLAMGLASGSIPVAVTPGVGRPNTNFHVSFRSPERTGTRGTLRRYEVLSANAATDGTNCQSRISMTLPSADQGHLVRVTLRPQPLEGIWCVGRFSAKITEDQMIICERIHACPDIVIAPRTIARFSFRVESH